MIEDRRTNTIPTVKDRRNSLSDETFSFMLDKMSIMVVITLDDKIVYANDAFTKVTGYTQEDISNIKVSDLIPNSDKKFLLTRIKERLEGDLTLPDCYFDMVLVKKDGSLFMVNLSPSIVCYKGNLCSIYTAIETTVQRKTEKALNGFFDYCPLPAFIKDKNRYVIKSTKFYEQMVDKTHLEVIGHTTDEIFPKEFADKINKEDEHVLNTKTPITIEEEIQGRIFIKTKFPINDELVGGFSIDITDRVTHRKEIEKSNQKYQELYGVLVSMLDDMPQMLWVYDESKNIQFMNKALREFAAVIDIIEACDCTMLPDKKEKFVKIFQKKSGGEVYLEIIKTPLRDVNNAVIGCSGYLKDVTDTIKRQEKIVKKLEKLEGQTKKDNKDVLSTLNNTITLFNNKLELV